MRRGDAKAKADGRQIVTLAASGDPKALQALACLKQAAKSTQGTTTAGWLDDSHKRGVALLLAMAKRGNPKARAVIQAAKTGSWRSLAPYSWGGAPNFQDLAEILYDAAPPEVQAIVQDKAKFKDMVQKVAASKFAASIPAVPVPQMAVPGAPKTGYYPFPTSARAGIDMSVKQLSPARILQLKTLIRSARYSAPKQLMARMQRA
jgi:hypothetical protein